MIMKKNVMIQCIFIQWSKYASPFITGLIAGSIPCPSAIAVLLIAANKFQDDFITLYSSIFIYVLGIALTLIGIMTLFLLFKDRFVSQLNSVNKKFNTNWCKCFSS